MYYTLGESSKKGHLVHRRKAEKRTRAKTRTEHVFKRKGCELYYKTAVRVHCASEMYSEF